MGLDLVELVMDIEDWFKIEIPDDEWADLRTVGDLYECVVRKREGEVVQPSRPRVCLTMVAFSRLRPALQAMANVPRRSVRPVTSVETLTPRSRRRADWETMRDFTELKFPELRRPEWLVSALAATDIAAVMSVVYGLTNVIPEKMAWTFGLVFVSPLLMIALVRITRPCATLLPANCGTVGGLSRVMLALNYGALRERYQGWGSDDVWGTLSGIVSEQLGVPLEEITYESRFVEDLGAC
jgi:acyl carrier protein